MNNPLIRSDKEVELHEAWKEGWQTGYTDCLRHRNFVVESLEIERTRWQKNAAIWKRRFEELEKKIKDQIDQGPLQS